MKQLREMKKGILERMKDIDTMYEVLNMYFHCGYVEKTAENLLTMGQITHDEFTDFIKFVSYVKIDLQNKTQELFFKFNNTERR